jgi:DHA1 family bicyclomycin/chloramphenicol resistance-like MFS transporter
MGFGEFVSLVAALMAVGALAIDTMLPALPQIATALHVMHENDRQWIITAYLLGLGVTQLVYGTLADHYGRKPVLMVGLSIFVVASLIAGFANSFHTMILARFVQGMGGACTRVLAVSIVRDRFSGRQMARVMSLSFIVFLGVPVIAPSLGQGLIAVAPWPLIFDFLALFALGVVVWVWLRLPETLHGEDRAPLSARQTLHAFKLTLTNRIAIGYTLAMSLAMGGLFGFINSAQQVFTTVFHRPKMFPVIFAVIAGSMAISALLNSRIVGRLGTRRVSHSALMGYIIMALLHVMAAMSGRETIWMFAALQGGMMFCFGFVGSNFGAMAMDPMGHLAGVASSVQGFISTVVGALLGIVISQHFDGTDVPLTMGFALLGLGALGVVLIAEKGRLFHPMTQPVPAAG